VEGLNIYFPQDDLLLIHQSRVKACLHNFPDGFYWYKGRRRGSGKPQWVEDLLRGPNRLSEQHAQDAALADSNGQSDQHSEATASLVTDGSLEYTEGPAPPHSDGLPEQHTENSVQQDSYGSS